MSRAPSPSPATPSRCASIWPPRARPGAATSRRRWTRRWRARSRRNGGPTRSAPSSWSPNAPPHDGNVPRAWAVAEAARARRIHIVPVAASGVDDLAEFVMRGMAALTQSRYLFLTDDSGIGNRHAEPAVDCYLVTRLDSLVRRVLDSLISGRRIEPADAEVIRSVGDYQNGRCVLPNDFQVRD